MKARLAAASLIHGTMRPDPPPPAAGDGEPASARLAAADHAPAGLSEPVFSARGVVMENAVVRGSSGAPEG